MLRQSFLYLSQQSWLRHWMENSPVSRRFTSRFIAGRTLDEGIDVVSRLARERMDATLDFLGENVQSIDEAARSLDSYLAALDQIQARRLHATVSIKLTQFGLDFSEQACRKNVRALVNRAQAQGSRVEIDMESSAYTDRTLALVRELHAECNGAVRAVLQAYLYRTEADAQLLSNVGIPVRLCKGAYREPPSVAFPQKDDVDRNYLQVMRYLLTAGVQPAVASHDEGIIQNVLAHVQEQKIGPERFEFQMLYGIRRDLQRTLASNGYRLRLYVPYGDAWYPYFMRRLAERPANVLFVARNLLRS